MLTHGRDRGVRGPLEHMVDCHLGLQEKALRVDKGRVEFSKQQERGKGSREQSTLYIYERVLLKMMY